jgi:hypothetical protein
VSRAILRAFAIASAVSISPALAASGAQNGSASAALAPPVPPAVVSRDETGHVIVRAARTTENMRIDGRLDEAVYGAVPAITDFVQALPREGEPATEKTEAWILFDGDAMYVAGRCWDSAPPSGWVANDLRRDSNQLRENDSFGVLFDTFHDRRNAFVFYTNPLGVLADQTFTDEGNPNRDWNPVWEVRTGRFDGGWTVEMAIPFKSLRYTSGTNQTWGVNLRRGVRRKNEWTHLTQLPPGAGGSQAWFRVSGAATLVGLDLPPAAKNIELKPYGIAGVTTDRAKTPPVAHDLDKEVGFDAKYGVTANLTADFTYNTDFAQVEIDEQQVNLTRFSLLFPEKREFFLEGRGIFEFGRGPSNAPFGGGGGGGMNNNITPQIFYSRRIGLNQGQVIPIEAGGRLTGKMGRTGVGIMNIEAGDETVSATPATNFTVLRVKQDILRRSSIGGLFTNRSQSVGKNGASQTYATDASFSFFQDVNLGAFLAKTTTPGLSSDDLSYQGRFDYGADRYGARLEYLAVGDNFNPEVGFVRRDNFKRTFGSLRFSPRMRRGSRVRKYTTEASIEHILNGGGSLETRQQTGRFNVEFENSDQFTVDATRDYELLLAPFTISGVTIPAGGYTFSDVLTSYAFGQGTSLAGTVGIQRGHYYNGTITALTLGQSRVSLSPQLSVEPSVALNHIELPAGVFTQKVIRTRWDYAFSARMSTSALVQFNSTDRAFSNNLRFRWEYFPGSELFVVYTDERNTRTSGFPDLKNRAFVVKINRLFRY